MYPNPDSTFIQIWQQPSGQYYMDFVWRVIVKMDVLDLDLEPDCRC